MSVLIGGSPCHDFSTDFVHDSRPDPFRAIPNAPRIVAEATFLVNNGLSDRQDAYAV
jgi:hypothetical protein